MSLPTADFDGAWKYALERDLPECLELLAPALFAAIDWSRGVTFLDTELQSIAPAALAGRAVDRLVRVWRRDGRPSWLLIHVEAQNQRDPAFDRRMLIYHLRLMDRFALPVYSLAILGDDEPSWQPGRYAHQLWDLRLIFEYPTIKLLDFRERLTELSAERNAFATVILAHLAALATWRDAAARHAAKLDLVRRLFMIGYDQEQGAELVRLIDWFLMLPEHMEPAFWRDVQHLEEEYRMTYITSIERIGLRRGLEQGREEGRSPDQVRCRWTSAFPASGGNRRSGPTRTHHCTAARDRLTRRAAGTPG